MTLSLHARGAPLAAPEKQIATVDSVDLSASAHGGDFTRALAASGRDALRPGPTPVLQLYLTGLAPKSRCERNFQSFDVASNW